MPTISDAEFERLYGGAPKSPVRLSDDEFNRTYGPAAAARERLSAQGLTPEMVKAGKGVTTPDQIKFSSPETHFWKGVGGAINPVNWAKQLAPAVENASDIVSGNPVRASTRMATSGIQAALARGEKPTGLDIASGVAQGLALPDFVGTAQEAYHRGAANKDISEMYGGVAGSALAAAAPSLVKGVLPTRAGAIETYSKVFGPNADPAAVAKVVPRLLDDRTVAASTDALAARGEEIVANSGVDQAIANMPNGVDLGAVQARINAGKEPFLNDAAIIKKIAEYTQNVSSNAAPLKEGIGSAISPENARSLRQSYDVIYNKRNPLATPTDAAKSVIGNALREELNKNPEVAAANSEAHIGKTLKTLAEDAPGAKGPPLLTTVGSAVGSYILHRTLGGLLGPGVAGGVAAYQIAKAVVKSPLFRTASAVLKNELSKAVAANDTTRAFGVASKIAGGVGLNDSLGHDQEVFRAVDQAYEKANGDPHVARQILAGQEAVYENPDGSTVKVPYQVYRSFLGQLGPAASNSNSSLASGNAQGR